MEPFLFLVLDYVCEAGLCVIVTLHDRDSEKTPTGIQGRVLTWESEDGHTTPAFLCPLLTDALICKIRGLEK